MPIISNMYTGLKYAPVSLTFFLFEKNSDTTVRSNTWHYLYDWVDV